MPATPRVSRSCGPAGRPGARAEAVWLDRASGRKNDDGGSHPHAAVEIDHVLVGHADTAGRDRLADILRLVGAVDAVECVLAAFVEIDSPGTKRVPRATRDARRIWAKPRLDVGRGYPVRPFRHAADLSHTRPCLSLLAHRDAVA